ncbi:thioredoxin family protein [Candidatus Desantisbacteria bacterium]|nr:thioredoxin family protein [Candidatus Desantisbacteria bacterium]
MLRLCICLIAMSLIGCQYPVQGKQESGVGGQGAEVRSQEAEPQIPSPAPSGESLAPAKGTETVAAVVQQKPEKPEKPAEVINIQWVNSFDEGLEMAKARNCPLMVDFSAEWCGWCKKLDEETWTDKNVIQLAQRFVCVKIDCDTDRQTPARYGARSLPTILFITPDEKVIHHVLGYRNPEDMIAEMNKAGQ